MQYAMIGVCNKTGADLSTRTRLATHQLQSQKSLSVSVKGAQSTQKTKACSISTPVVLSSRKITNDVR